METADDSIEQFGLACLEVHGVIAESAQDMLLRSVIGVVELTLALALTRDFSISGADYRMQSVALFLQLTDAIERGESEETAAIFAQCRALDRAQVF